VRAMREAYRLTIVEASSLMRKGELTPIQLLDSVLGRIHELEPKVEAWVTLDEEGATAAAERLTKEAEEGSLRSPVHGIPVGIKDIYFTEGLKTTMGSPLYGDYIPTQDAETVRLLKEAGAIIPGKTETTEFAYIDPAPTRNPWSLEHTPGGSSSGSAAAVSSGMCPSALGSQTGGSVIRPAAFCGVVGMKPTYDLISRRGVYPLSWSLDHVGFFTRTVEDAGIMLGVLTGRATEWEKPVDEGRVPRFGLLRGFFEERAHEAVWEGFEEAVERLRDAGADVVEAALPDSFGLVLPAHSVIFASETASIHQSLFGERREDYRPHIRGLIASGLLVPASAYLKAMRFKGRFMREVGALLRDFDCLLTPASVTPALRGLESTGDASFNSPWSLCGFPSITVPSGLTAEGLPVGLQLVAGPYGEGGLLGAAGWCEEVLGFPKDPVDP
jgi:aspartyl-tRNA(Asn)/glutamyl-tRNA(Gln) amidotransferase subunit A